MENREIDTARQIIEYTNTSLFLTGRAGTGKTTFLRRLRTDLPKRMVVLAPTGIAAINAGGVTLHSFFQLPFSPYIPGTAYNPGEKRYAMNKQKLRLIRSLDLLVIDEISMVRADLLDAVDDALRRYRRNGRPFGGVQLLLIGDLQQLAPVVKDEEWAMLSAYYDTPYFFSSRALRQMNYATVELKKVYRQTDEAFLSLLNAVREGHVTPPVLAQLNARYVPGYTPSADGGAIQLVTHNWQAHQINEAELSRLAGQPFTFKAKVKGKFPEMSFPTDEDLVLKTGAQVMFVKNDVDKRYFNGMIGHVTAIGAKGFRVRPDREGAGEIDVPLEEWSNTRYVLNDKTNEIEEVTDGTFEQYPVKLAWAITIHKSQGLTFDRIVINAAGAFAHGQTYVALSRCRTLEGITLTTPIPASAVIADSHVDAFNADMRAHQVDEQTLSGLKNNYALTLLTNLYSFEAETYSLETVNRVFQEFLFNTYGETARTVQAHLAQFRREVVEVAQKFHVQYGQMLAGNGGDISSPALQERLQKGAAYFLERLQDLAHFFPQLDVTVDNAVASKRLSAATEELTQRFALHINLFAHVCANGFVPKDYLKARAKFTLEAESGKTSAQMRSKAKPERVEAPSEIVRPALYARLREWRKQKMEQLNLPAYSIVSNNALIGLANLVPEDATALKRVPYFGTKGRERYGEEILELIQRYKREQAENPNAEEEKPVPRLSAKEQRKQAREAAPPVKKTWEESFDLYKAGHTVDEIATLRSLKRGTVCNHLARYVPSGEVKLSALVSDASASLLRNYFSAHPLSPETTRTEVFNALGGQVSYDDIHVVLALMQQKAKQQGK